MPAKQNPPAPAAPHPSGQSWTLPPTAPPVGRSTVEAIQSGLIYGYAGLVDGLVERILAQVDAPVPVVATGGLAPIVVAHTRLVKDIQPDLTLVGLAEIFALNNEGA